jgi:hypothetical protein
MHKWLIILVLILAAIFFYLNREEALNAFETIKAGDWRFILLAIFFEALWLLNVAASYFMIYRGVGIEERFEKLILLASAANAFNIVAPTGVGMGGMAVFISEAQRRGYSSARATIASVLYIFFDYVGFLVILALGILVLFRRGNLMSTELISALILLGMVSFFGYVLYLGTQSGERFSAILTWLARNINRVLFKITKKNYFSEQRAHSFAFEASEGLRMMRSRHLNILIPTGLAFTSKLLLLIIFWMMFLAFNVPFSPGTIIAGFSIGYLFLVVSPTPAGIGVMEGALTLVLTTLGVPFGMAAVIALAYRGVTFWLPLLVGIGSMRWVSSAGIPEPTRN